MKKVLLLIVLSCGVASDVHTSSRYRYVHQEQSWSERFVSTLLQPERVADAIWGVGTAVFFFYLIHKILPDLNVKYKPVKVTEKFSSVAGASEAKEALQHVVNYLKDPKHHSRLGAHVPHGVLLEGNPGNGKTLLARAVAGEANCSFFSVTGSEFVELYVGMGARKIRALFAAARKHAPSIIFIDEIDAVGRQRGMQGSHMEIEQTLNQLLAEMDGFQVSDKPVIVIAATNRAEILDEALMRPGRFDQIIYVKNPDIKSREEILKLHASKVAMDPYFDFKKVALATRGFSGAQLANLINQATTIASQEGKNFVDMQAMEEAFERIVLGGKPSPIQMSKEEKIATAYHEAGHTLINILLSDLTEPLHKVTIVPRGMSLGSTHSLPDEEKYSQYKDEMIALVKVCLGGRIAEEIVFGGNISGGASNDFEKATDIIRYMICKLGMSEKLGVVAYERSQAYSAKITREISSMMKQYYQETKDLMIKHRKQLDMIAQELLRKGTLTGQEIYDLVGMQPLPNRSKQIIMRNGGQVQPA